MQIHLKASDDIYKMNDSGSESEKSFDLPAFRPGNIAVFTGQDKNIQINALLSRSYQEVILAFNSLGRYLPVEKNRLEAELRKNEYNGNEGMAAYRKAAEELGVDAFVVISAWRQGAVIYSRLDIVSLTGKYKINRSLAVKSKLPINIPFKLKREVARLHENLNLRARVLKSSGNYCLLDAGQWHGLCEKEYDLNDGRSIRIIKTGRYYSIAEIPQKKVNEYITVLSSPDISRVSVDAGKRIEYNTIYKYGLKNSLLKGADPEEKFIQGACIINPGANACLPGYGSFLATAYLGFEQGRASVPGVVVSSVLLLNHFCLTEFMTGFRSNFFPWIRDNDKNSRVNNLQWYLWGTLPLTLTASYMEQLAFQFHLSGHIPPFFKERDEAAAVFSAIVPGGGLFYKGYRFAGWGCYFTEMFIGGYGFYYLGSGNRSVYAFSVLGGIKLLEMVTAYFIKPSYTVFSHEISGKQNDSGEWKFALRPQHNGISYTLSRSFIF